MKKFMFLSLLALGSLLPAQAAVQVGDTISSSKYVYVITSDSTCKVVGLAKTNQNPEAINLAWAASKDNVNYAITRIENGAFKGQTALKSVDLQYSMEQIGASAFENCTALTTLNLGTGVKNIGSKAFSNCSALTDVTWPMTLEIIGGNAFEYTGNINSLCDVDSLKSIGYQAFMGSKIKDINLGNAVTTSIGIQAFNECQNLRRVVFPKALTTIPVSCNLSNSSLSSVVFGPNLKQINVYAFAYSTSLGDITFQTAEPPTCNKNAFEFGTWPHVDYDNCVLYVPKGSIEAYRNNEIWSKFKTITDSEYDPDAPNMGITQLWNNPNVEINEPFNKGFATWNKSNDTIKNITYTITIDGGAPVTRSVYRMIPPKNTRPYGTSFQFDAIPTEGPHQIVVTVDSVDGKANAGINKTFETTLYAFESRKGLPANAKSIDWMDSQPGGSFGTGDYDHPHHEVAMHFKDSRFNGMKIVAIEPCWFRGGDENYVLWTSQSLPKEIKDATIEISDTLPEVNRNVMFVLKNPITVTDAGVWMGYALDRIPGSLDGEARYPIPFLYDDEKNPYYRREGLMSRITRNGNWDDETVASGWVSNIRVWLTGDFPQADFKVTNTTGLNTTAVGDTCTVNFFGQNNGLDEAKTLTYNYTIDGVDYERTYTLPDALGARLLMTQRFLLPIDGFTTPGRKEFDVTITKINGLPNKSADAKVKVGVTVAAERPVHHVLFEEGTGTWCGWCPRGVAAVYYLEKEFPNFIGIVYHCGDIMMTNPRFNTDFIGTGLPACTLDRGEKRDPFWGIADKPFGIADEYRMTEKAIAPATINLDTKWDDDYMHITVDADVNWIVEEEGVTYKLGYVAIVDGLTGTDSDWKQINGYGDNPDAYKNDPYLHILVDGSLDLNTYNHVAFAGNNMGVENSLPAVLTSGSNYKHSFTIDCSKYDLYDESLAEDVSVVAMLIDSNGFVRNARKVKAGESAGAEVGISEISALQQLPIEYYDLQGRRISNPQHGIFIKKVGNQATKIVK